MFRHVLEVAGSGGATCSEPVLAEGGAGYTVRVSECRVGEKSVPMVEVRNAPPSVARRWYEQLRGRYVETGSGPIVPTLVYNGVAIPVLPHQSFEETIQQSRLLQKLAPYIQRFEQRIGL